MSDLMTNVVKKKKSKRIFYFDALRAFAILSVVIFHVSIRTKLLMLGDFGVHPGINWYIGAFLGVSMRTGVDVFLMLSGALSLGREWDIKSFLGKRLPRIVGPFIFWASVLSCLIVALTFTYPDIFHAFDPVTKSNALHYIKGAFLAESQMGFQTYWFFWMIIGTYLIMPIFNKWLLHADLKEAEYFLAIWLITCIFDFTINQEFPIKISYFSGPIGMVVLGYYLRHTKRKIFDNLYVPALLTIGGIVILMAGSYFKSSPDSLYTFSRYSIFMAIEVAGIFLLFRNIGKYNIHSKFLNNPNGLFRKGVLSLATYSYGIYLVHAPIIDITKRLALHYGIFNEYVPMVVFFFVVTVGASWIVMATLNRVPYINRVIGAK